MRLLIDCGNSSIKFALNMKLEVKKIIEVRLNNPKKLSLDLSKTLNALLKKRNIYRKQ
jgi:pantothenate kinase type III